MASVGIKTEPEEIKDLLETCRLCLSEESTECVPLEPNLWQWISDYLSIVICTEDGLSQKICAVCRKRLTEFHQFRERCQEVQTTLQSIIHTENHEVKTELLLHNSNDGSEPVPVNLYQGSLGIQENDIQKINTAIDNGTTNQGNQNLHTYSENEEALMNGQSIGIEEVIIKHELEYDRKSPVPSTDDSQTPNEERIIQCTICNEVFFKKNELTYHRTKYHGSTFSCPICNRPFVTRSGLKKHVVVHEGTDAVRPFKCDICERAFKRKDDIYVHKKRVHGPRLHKCSICGFCFATRVDLARHTNSNVHNYKPSKASLGKRRTTTGGEQKGPSE